MFKDDLMNINDNVFNIGENSIFKNESKSDLNININNFNNNVYVDKRYRK